MGRIVFSGVLGRAACVPGVSHGAPLDAEHRDVMVGRVASVPWLLGFARRPTLTRKR